MLNKFKLASIMFVLFLISCQKEVGFKEYYKVLNDSENGMIQSKSINGLILTVKYLPANFLAFDEIRKDKYFKGDKDSLLKQYQNGHNILLSIAPDPKVRGNQEALYLGLKSFQEFDDRVHALNFELEQFTKVLEDVKYESKPILSVLGNTFGLQNNRSVVMTFPVENQSFKEVVFEFDDPFFQTGKSKFKFLKEDIKELPIIKEWQTL